MDFHSITDKFFVLDLPENLISTEAKQDSDLILSEYESVIPDVIKNLGNINLSSCFLNERSQHSNINDESRTNNQSWNKKKESSWRKFCDSDKKFDDLGIVNKFYPWSMKKVKEVEIKLITNNNNNLIKTNNNYLSVINNERFSLSENKLISYNPKTQTEIGKIIGSILKFNQKENYIKNSKYVGLSAKYKIQDLYKINQIYKLENSQPMWYIICNYTINNKNTINTNEFTMGPFSSECIVSFSKQGEITEDTKLKIEKAIFKEEKTNSKLYALLNNQQGIKLKNLLKALNPKEEGTSKKKKSFNNLSYKVESDAGYFFDNTLNYQNYNQNSGSNSSKNNPSKKFSYKNNGSSHKKDSYDDGSKINLRQNNFNYSDEYYYSKIMNKDEII
jgi:hypothetical protein